MNEICKNCNRNKICKNCKNFKHCVRVYNLYSCCCDYEAKPMTNDEWRRICSTEEFAEFVRKQRDDWSDGWYSDWHNTEEIIEWLKEKHE